MGVDFLKSKARAFTKGWDRSRLELARRSLFTVQPPDLSRSAVAKIVGAPRLNAGDTVLIRSDGDGLAVVVELNVAARFVHPPEDISKIVEEQGGCVAGSVQASFPTLGLVEVALR
jgi:hypothetical protein